MARSRSASLLLFVFYLKLPCGTADAFCIGSQVHFKLLSDTNSIMMPLAGELGLCVVLLIVLALITVTQSWRLTLTLKTSYLR